MRKYLMLISIQFKSNFYYRVSTYAGIVVGIIQLFVLYYIWSTVFENNEIIAGFNKDQIITYFIFSTVIYRLIEFGIILRVSDMVRSGEIALKLIKPIHFIKSIFFESMGLLFANIFTLVLPMMIFSIVVFDMYIQVDLLSNLSFVISVLLALSISLFIDLIFGLCTFWTENGWGLRVIRQALIKLLSGALIPFAFLPGWFSKITDFLPFKSLVDIPLTIYFNKTNLNTVKVISIQVMWLLILVVITKALYNVIVKRLDINGG